jgi:hypothetical protein
MMIHCSPLSLSAPQDADMKDRFFYWSGASGRKYIHSVYNVEACPPLPGAIYVAVKRQGALRIALAIGRFAPFEQNDLDELEYLGADEVHVHLLAHDVQSATFICNDLKAGLGEGEPSFGLSEAAKPWGLTAVAQMGI